MKTTRIILLVLIIVGLGFLIFNTMDKNIQITNTDEANTRRVDTASTENSELGEQPFFDITPIEHATMILRFGDVNVYVDPVGGSEAFIDRPAATIVLMTDIHGDHFSTSTLNAVVSEETIIIAPQAVMDLLPENLKDKTTVLANAESFVVQGIRITGVPMYNVPETEDSRHTKGRGNGYLLAVNDMRVYIAGDTGPTEEMKALTDIDIAFVPMNLPYTMSVDEAAQAVLTFAPTKVFPYHYRQPDGFADVERFKSLVNAGNPAIEVVLLPWYTQ